MPFSAVAHLEGLSLETLLTLKVEKFLICFVGTLEANSIHDSRKLILFLKT
jgi:hypothetical protein